MEQPYPNPTCLASRFHVPIEPQGTAGRVARADIMHTISTWKTVTLWFFENGSIRNLKYINYNGTICGINQRDALMDSSLHNGHYNEIARCRWAFAGR